MTIAVPLPGGSPVTLCDSCTFGFSIVRFGAPFMSWTADEKSVFVPLRYFGFGTGKTLVIPTSAGSSPPAFVNGPSSEEQLEHLPGAQIINEDNADPGQSRARYVAVRRSTKANLFRIYLPQ